MHVPPVYRGRPADARRLVLEHPFATLVTNGQPVPFITHIPVAPTRSARPDDPASLVGDRLLGHMDRANPHWERLAAAGESVLIFRGPDGYLTPTAYAVSPAAPTWDFAVVHLRGTVSRTEDDQATRETMRATVSHLESVADGCWNMTDSLEYFDRLLPGVGAFQFEVRSCDAMFKLSQEQPAEVRARVIEDLHHRGRSELALLIAAAGEPVDRRTPVTPE